jgi:hypothetical protein
MFLSLCKSKKSCVIYNQTIIIEKTNREKIKENIMYFVLISPRFLATINCLLNFPNY